MSTTSDVQELYIGLLGRAADPDGLAYWVGQIDAGTLTLEQLRSNIVNEQPEYANGLGLDTRTQLVNALYENMFERQAGEVGLTYWVDGAGSTVPADSLVLALDNAAKGTDRLTLDNKVEAATYYTANTLQAAYTNALATASVSSVDGTAASVTASKAATDAGGAAGEAFTLTTAIDTFVGSTGDDTFTGSATYTAAGLQIPASGTLQAGDSMAGGGGLGDVLNYVISGVLDGGGTAGGDAVNLVVADVSAIETLNIRNVASSALAADVLTLDASNFSGLTAFNAERSTGALTITNLASGASAGAIGNGALVNGALNAGYVAAATSAILNLSSGTAATAATVLSGTGLTSTTVNSTGAANTIGALTLAATTTALTVDATTNLTTGAVTNTGAAALTTLTVTGAGAVDLSSTALEATVSTINASANTGGLTVALGSLVTQTVTGGTGADVITTQAILTTGSVDAGDGTDTLALGDVNQANTTTLAAKYTNFETLRLNGTFDASLISSITGIELTAATNAITKMTATQAAAVTAFGTTIGATTFALASSTGTSDVLTIKLGTGDVGIDTNNAAANTSVLTINGFETLNLATNAGSTATSGANRTSTVTGAIVGDKLTAVNLTGTAVTFTNIATTKVVTINGSALVGNGAATSVGLTVGGDAKVGSTITGSAVKDTFALGAVGSTYNAGAGNDAITATAITLLENASVFNTIDAGDGTDTLTFTAAALTMVDSNFSKLSNLEKVVIDADAAAGDVSVTTGGFYVTNFGTAADVTILVSADAATFSGATFTGAQTLSVTSATTAAAAGDNIDIDTGAGADIVTVTASSWVGAVGATSTINVNTGAGVDTISVTTGTSTANATTANQKVIDAGTGADIITLAGVNDTEGESYYQLVTAAGDSTISAYDTVTGFDIADGTLQSDALDFDTATTTGAVAATVVTGFTSSELTVALTATTGLAVFAGTSAASISASQALTAIDQVITDDKTAIWNDGTDTYVFNADADGDSIVQLVGVVGTALIAVEVTTASGVSIM